MTTPQFFFNVPSAKKHRTVRSVRVILFVVDLPHVTFYRAKRYLRQRLSPCSFIVAFVILCDVSCLSFSIILLTCVVVCHIGHLCVDLRFHSNHCRSHPFSFDHCSRCFGIRRIAANQDPKLSVGRRKPSLISACHRRWPLPIDISVDPSTSGQTCRCSCYSRNDSIRSLVHILYGRHIIPY